MGQSKQVMEHLIWDCKTEDAAPKEPGTTQICFQLRFWRVLLVCTPTSAMISCYQNLKTADSDGKKFPKYMANQKKIYILMQILVKIICCRKNSIPAS